jgi:hypothetical protein
LTLLVMVLESSLVLTIDGKELTATWHDCPASSTVDDGHFQEAVAGQALPYSGRGRRESLKASGHSITFLRASVGNSTDGDFVASLI